MRRIFIKMGHTETKKNLSITVATDKSSWLRPYLEEFVRDLGSMGHWAHLVFSADDISSGDIVFFVGFQEIVKEYILNLNKHNLVVHESALPQGKGWSPLSWQILEGKNNIPIILFEAVKEVDAGPIYFQDIMVFSGDELVDELRVKQADATIRLCERFVEGYPMVLDRAVNQQNGGSYYRRRTTEDSQLDVHKTIAEQFNLLRVVDNVRYPAFFEIGGVRYRVTIEKYYD